MVKRVTNPGASTSAHPTTVQKHNKTLSGIKDRVQSFVLARLSWLRSGAPHDYSEKAPSRISKSVVQATEGQFSHRVKKPKKKVAVTKLLEHFIKQGNFL